MKILHCCLAAFYIDNFSYQENILPKIHKTQGYDVAILASTETYLSNIKLGYIQPSTYLTKEEIPITRIPYIKWLPKFIVRKLRIYSGIKSYLEIVKPDIIFLHDSQFLSIVEFVAYAKKNDVKIYIDSHTDFINSGRNWISKNLLHKVIYKFCAKYIEKYATKFYGTLPIRVDFIHDIYGIDKNKIELLPFGADDSLFESKDKDTIRNKTRIKLQIDPNDFVIITGGKIDSRKNIHILMKAFIELTTQSKLNKIKLIVFGKPTIEMKDEIDSYISNPMIKYLEWIPSEEIHTVLLASDVAFFPGTHSVLWEEAVGLGLPCVFYKWEGIQHVDLGGNCLFISSVEIEMIKDVILKLVNDQASFSKMKLKAEELGPEKFAYSKIATQALS
jgi:glycosyltransferase involved in cell wall biosynthesis